MAPLLIAILLVVLLTVAFGVAFRALDMMDGGL
jgi:hypothetical protein